MSSQSSQCFPPLSAALAPSATAAGTHNHQHRGRCEDDECKDGPCSVPHSKPTPLNVAMIGRSMAALSRANIFQAVETGDVPLVHYLLTRVNPMSLKMMDEEGNTPLHACAKAGHVDLAMYLLDLGMPIDLTNSLGHTPLMLALADGNIAICIAFIKRGADVNRKDSLGFSPVIHAAQHGDVFGFHSFLMNASVDINDVDNDGHSVLCWACYSGHLELLEYMLSDNCPQVPHLGAMDHMKRTPMHWAASQNFPQVCTYLATKSCPLCSKSPERGVAAAEGGGSLEGSWCPSGAQMLELRDDDGKTPADCAHAKGHDETSRGLEVLRSVVCASGTTAAAASALSVSGGAASSAAGAQPLTSRKRSDIDDPEKIAQFLSSFIPILVFFFIVAPYLPAFVFVILSVATIGVHYYSVRWSNPARTLVPAGVLYSALIAMFRGTTLMECTPFASLLIVAHEVAFALLYYNLYTGDPGIIPHSDSFYKRTLELATKGVDPSSDYCRKCKVIKPLRAKHCHACDTCTIRFDHHCFWISNCVAKKNYRRFYFLMCIGISATFIFDCMAISFFRAKLAAEVAGPFLTEGLSYLTTYHAQLFWSSIFFACISTALFVLWLFHMSFIGRDVTTYEMLTRFKSSPGLGPKKFSFMRIVAFWRHGADIFFTGSDSGSGSAPPGSTATNISEYSVASNV